MTGYECAKGISLNETTNKCSPRPILLDFLFAASVMRAANMALPQTQMPISQIPRIYPSSLVS